MVVAGDAVVAYAEHEGDGGELAVRRRQTDFICSMFLCPEFTISNSFHRFTSSGIEGIERVDRAPNTHLIVLFLCHGNVNSGHPARAQDVSTNADTSAEVVIRSITCLRKNGDWKSHWVIPSQCYGGLDFKDILLATLDAGWKIWRANCDATTVEPVYIQREAMEAVLSWFIPANRSNSDFWLPGRGNIPCFPTQVSVEIVSNIPMATCLQAVPSKYKELAKSLIETSINSLNLSFGEFGLPASGPSAEVTICWKITD